jgi:hypothetical protein
MALTLLSLVRGIEADEGALPIIEERIMRAPPKIRSATKWLSLKGLPGRPIVIPCLADRTKGATKCNNIPPPFIPPKN